MPLVRHTPSRLAPAVVTIALSSLSGGCAGEAAPARAPVVSIPSPPPSPVSAWLDHLRVDDRQLKEAVRAILDSGDAMVRREASRRLVQEARSLGSTAWRDAKRELLRRADADAHLDPTPRQLEAQLDRYRDEQLLRVAGAMEEIGGPEAVAYAFELAENEGAPTSARQAALVVLYKHLQDAAGRARAAALKERVAARASAEEAAAKPVGGTVANALSVVAGMAAAFRRCYNEGLAQNPKMKGSIRVTTKIGQHGEVLSVTSSGQGLTPVVVSCIETRVSAATFDPPDGGGATIIIPVSFVAADPPAAPAPAPP